MLNIASRVTLLLFHFRPHSGQKFHTIRLKSRLPFSELFKFRYVNNRWI